MQTESPLDTHMDLKWKIRCIAANRSSSIPERYQSIDELLLTYSVPDGPRTQKLGIKGKVYEFLFRHRLTLLTLALETALANDVKRYIPVRSINHIRHFFMTTPGSRRLQRTGKTAFVFMVPDLGNLGDLAIGLAQKEFLESKLPNYQVIEVPQRETYESARAVKKQIKTGDLVFLTGGGNIGTLYKDAELQRRFLIKMFSSNPIIQFPQSAHFERTPTGDRFLRQSIEAYGRHPDLTLIARDEPTYESMRQWFPRNEISLLPDTVLSLSPITSPNHRDSRIVLSIRRDVESALTTEHISAIKEIARDLHLSVLFRDTNIDNLHHNLQERTPALTDIWDTYMSSKMVITDRLHGVIFCAITGTPCIALDNSNGKVHNMIRSWLEEAKYIRMITALDAVELRNSLDSLLATYPDGANPIQLNEKFHSMLSLIKRKCIAK